MRGLSRWAVKPMKLVVVVAGAARTQRFHAILESQSSKEKYITARVLLFSKYACCGEKAS
jgi:hypothetical protein